MSPDVGRFPDLNDTLDLHRLGKAVIKRGPVSPFEDEEAEDEDKPARRVRWQPAGGGASAGHAAGVGAGLFHDDADASPSRVPAGRRALSALRDGAVPAEAVERVTLSRGLAARRGGSGTVGAQGGGDDELVRLSGLHLCVIRACENYTTLF